MAAGRWSSVGNLRGPRGIPGPEGDPGAQGLPGANAIPTDAAVAAYIETPGTSATRGALDGAFTPLTSFAEWSQPNNPDGAGPGGITVGAGAAANVPRNTTAKASEGYLAMGRDALGAATRARSCIAIGPLAMGKGNPGFNNLAIGAFALTNVQGISEFAADMPGSRNIGIGSLAGHFISSGYQNTMIGRDSGHSITTGTHNVGVGYRAISSGFAPIGLSGKIENQYPGTGFRNVGLGVSAGALTVGAHNTHLGNSSGQSMSNGSWNTIVGSNAALTAGIDVSENGKALARPGVAGNYLISGTTITVTAAASGAVAGNKVSVRFTSGVIFAVTAEPQWLTVGTVTNGNTFTIVATAAMEGSGTVVVEIVETTTVASAGNSNTIIGYSACGQSPYLGSSMTIVGEQAALMGTGGQNAILGARAGYNLTSGDNNSFLGYNAGRAKIGGGGLTSESFVTCIGSGSGASGSNQVQLGGAADTTYVYGTVQNRSDMRDKADVRDTELGLSFIQQLRPVDYRWDMREDYVTYDEDGNAIHAERDGSKKRARYHHGFIAQEVQALSDGFGGLQDHSINGGSDVLSIGYDELIAPLVKAVQELTERIKELEVPKRKTCSEAHPSSDAYHPEGH